MRKIAELSTSQQRIDVELVCFDPWYGHGLRVDVESDGVLFDSAKFLRFGAG